MSTNEVELLPFGEKVLHRAAEAKLICGEPPA
jgi:hypothetical protein